MKTKTALMIVAHPDDETIWAGGTIMKNKNWDWTIISLCRKEDLDRMPKFRKVCKHYGARGIMGDLDDEFLQPLEIEEVESKIKQLLPEKKYDYLFTHGENGEYGHLRHKEVHRAVKDLIAKNELISEKVSYFSYIPSDREFMPGLNFALADEKANEIVKLDKNICKQKMEIITKMYGFSEKSFESLSCGNLEAFNLK